MSLEVTLLVWSVLVLFAHIGIQSGLLTRDLGSDYNAGPRDESRTLSPVAGRAERALRNFLETWPAFIALALVVQLTDASSWVTQLGAILYLVGRIVYIPLYLAAIKYVRSLAFAVSSAGLLMMFVGVLS
ncbi:MAPEG family protein [Pelagibacterium montanilacus]|uniref:MAPEG family protein n=1 Tax=Pelagibacterium montanilacus TaxID=2185280 RepID=UPI000F8E8314|nr:MAPEG family protein [Pelagibacterium montanilacus]